jgi:hypothetical protein
MIDGTRHVFRWDLDKTYLRTEFDRVRDLLKTAFETAHDKRAVPGAPALLRALRQTPGNRICIISGSPQQMKSVLAAKLALDGVEYDEFVLKDNLKNLLRGRFRAMRSQVPYKLPVLLASRRRLHGTPAETLCGDDAEADAVVYSLYADVMAGNIPEDELSRILAAARAYEDQIELTLSLARAVEHTDPVQRILIHLDRRSPTAGFERYGRRLVPVYNYFQAAVVLYADQVLSARQVLFVAKDMLEDDEYELSTLANSLQDLLLRGRVSRATATQLALECEEAARAGALGDAAELPPYDQIAWAFAVRVRDLGDAPPLEWPEPGPRLDYVRLVDADHRRRKRRSL